MNTLPELLTRIDERRDHALHMTRIRRGLSHYSLADACRERSVDVRAMYRATDRGNPTIKTIHKLSSAIGVSVSWLLCGDLHEIDWLDEGESQNTEKRG